ncbi:hypothetical protein TW85_18150 [Marinomonas sp. S3726]|uniref:C40 family peptidase n=1 Tax=Marinomonas sp. S3726 TaxID=579484 RepID=UPI0005FA2CBE|nr:SH3 domain-containing C40 family peptidase [Marinomonas sp. S3726]KJZ10979.1 hypothetical protein TW85_18150 [Marinomonas sp. S3726]
MKLGYSASLALLSLLISACTSTPKITEIADLKNLPQTAESYTQSIGSYDFDEQARLDAEYNKTFFSPWDITQMSYDLEQASWGSYYLKKETYGENHKLRKKEWYEEQIRRSNFEEYDTVREYAITTHNTDLRVFPTQSVIFYNPDAPGEGFPFDYNQNSHIKINTPLFVSHYSLDKAWVYVEANSLFGWLPVKDVVLMNKTQRDSFKNGNYYVSTQDDFALFDKANNFIEYIRLGTIFPVIAGELVTVQKNHQAGGTGVEFVLSTANAQNVAPKPLKFNQANLNKVSNALIGEDYGWGGVLANRDCSAFTKDFFTPFGVYLKRNSSKQLEAGEYIELKELDNQGKKQRILDDAVPFMTLIYLRGHIMLYVGEKAGEPLVFHNIWGLRTLEEDDSVGRFIIGRAVITTLEPGKELPNLIQEASILSKVQGMVLLDKAPKPAL